MAAASVVVSGDTGVAHLATAYRRPSVVLFGPVSPANWGPPPRPQHVVLWHGEVHQGTGDPWGAQVDPALGEITVEEVTTALDQIVASRAPVDVSGQSPAQRRAAMARNSTDCRSRGSRAE